MATLLTAIPLASLLQTMPMGMPSQEPSGPTLVDEVSASRTTTIAGLGRCILLILSLVLEERIRLPNRPIHQKKRDVVILESNPLWRFHFGRTNPCHWWEAMQRTEKLGVLGDLTLRKIKRDEWWLRRLDEHYWSRIHWPADTRRISSSAQGNWIEKVPEHFRPWWASSGDYYIAGWWPHNDVLAGKVMAISGELMGQPLFVCRKSNQPSTPVFFRWVAMRSLAASY